MILQILIPRYNEPEEAMCRLLNSIALQQNIDFNEVGVIICEDGSDTTLSSELLQAYPFNIQYIAIPHSGVSAARQACLDIADADYVMWCDIDDMFYSPIGLLTIFRTISDGGFYIMESKFIEETIDEDGNFIYIEHDDSDVFVHGKIFNRDWLIKNAIRWDTSLTIHEDSYFICLAKECCGNEPPYYKYCDIPFYLWKWSAQSISRADPQHYMVKTLGNLIESNAALLRELLKREMREAAYHYCCSLVLSVYYYSNTSTFLDEENQKYVDKINSEFRGYYREFGWLFEQMDVQKRKEMGQTIRAAIIDDPINIMDFEYITLKDWFEEVVYEETENVQGEIIENY